MRHPADNGMSKYFAPFGIKQDIAVRLFSHTIALVLHEGMCKECGEHVAPLLAIEAIISGINDYATDENQRNYVMYAMGRMAKDVIFWETFLLNCKKDTFENTFKAVKLAIDYYITEMNSPLN